jgi:hypothetical protein
MEVLKMKLADINSRVIKEIDKEEMKLKVLQFVADAYEIGLNNGYLNGVKGIMEMGTMFGDAALGKKKSSSTGYI